MSTRPTRVRDDRIERALADPDTYFRQARERARAEVVAEMSAERARRGSTGWRERLARVTQRMHQR